MDTLICVDVQNDFIDGSLGNKQAQLVYNDIVKFVETFKGSIIYTQDTHNNYETHMESLTIPAHCNPNTKGYEIPESLQSLFEEKGAIGIKKYSFMPLFNDMRICHILNVLDEIRTRLVETEKHNIFICGFCTDICVLNTALFLRNAYTDINTHITVLEDLCAGTTPTRHFNALDIMKQNGIIV